VSEIPLTKAARSAKRFVSGRNLALEQYYYSLRKETTGGNFAARWAG
jgi:hypothetical protein